MHIAPTTPLTARTTGTHVRQADVLLQLQRRFTTLTILVIRIAVLVDTQEQQLTSTALHGPRVTTATGTYAPSAEKQIRSRLTFGTTDVILHVTLADTQEQHPTYMTTQLAIQHVTYAVRPEAYLTTTQHSGHRMVRTTGTLA